MITRDGYPYAFDPTACRRCPGRCCNGESGVVRVTEEDAVAMAQVLAMPLEVFTARYLLVRGGELRVREIRDGHNYACALYDPARQGCSVYPARPRQCRTFPFWESARRNLAALIRECPGVVAGEGGSGRRSDGH